jgi:hypothetical protein
MIFLWFSNLLFAAYSVAVSANDVEYFANICKDVSHSLESEDGRLACEAQDEVLQVCDQLYLNQKITDNQLLYLRHLVLIRDEAVADIYDDFQDRKLDVAEMAKSLYELANQRPHFNTGPVTKLEDEKGLNDQTSSSVTQNASSSTPVKIQKYRDETLTIEKQAAQLSDVVVSMIDEKVVSSDEAKILVEMIRQRNEYVLAAFELYLEDGDRDELIDTLLRSSIQLIILFIMK